MDRRRCLHLRAKYQSELEGRSIAAGFAHDIADDREARSDQRRGDK